MKISGGVKLSVIVCSVAFFSSVTGYIFGARANDPVPPPQKEEVIPMVKSTAEPAEDIPVITKEDEITKIYLLREKDGKAALFYKYSNGNEELYKTYDISVSLLPQSDRELLKEGIEVKSLSEALQLVEDYS